MAKLLLVLSMVVVLAGCAKNEVEKRSVEYFSTHLKVDMNYEAITREWGEPDDDIGSGIHIYVYNLKDNTAIWIGYTDRILYARHMDSNGQLIHSLI